MSRWTVSYPIDNGTGSESTTPLDVNDPDNPPQDLIDAVKTGLSDVGPITITRD